MNAEIIISKSKFTCGDTCPYATVNTLTRPKEDVISDMEYILDNGKAVGIFARELFPEAVTVEHSNLNKQAQDTQKLIDSGTSTICEASFLKDDLFCAVDILKVTNPGHVAIVEVKSATKVKDIFYRDIAFQTYVVSQCGYIVDAAFLMYVNNEYIKDGELDPKQYFKVIDVTTEVYSLQASIKNDLAIVREALILEGEIEPPIAEHCFRPYGCPFWEKVCKPTLPENSIFEIKGGMRIATKIKLFRDGIFTMADFLKLKKQNPKYVQQCRLEVGEDDTVEVKNDELKAFLDKVSYPIISLDFETLIEAMQLFDGQKPYDQTVFQFSMHILWEYGGTLEHYEYLANPQIDWRRDLAHALVDHCPAEGTILVWNEAMEKNRILEFAELECNQDIRVDLINIAERILDLMVPFRNRTVYTRAMRGSYSIKKVLPALCPNDKQLSYEDLSINNGMRASMAFSSLVHSPEMSFFQAEVIKRNLLTYCELDTYGPFCILNVMYKLTNPDAPTLFEKTLKQDNTHRTIRVGNLVSTNVGNGIVVGFTPYFVRVSLEAGYTVIRMPHNLFNIAGMNISKFVNNETSSCEDVSEFRDATGHTVKMGDFVVTRSKLGKIVGRTNNFLKIQLADGKTVLRHGTFIIIK